MSSIHYKFRATLEYKTLQFDGLSILGGDLKREICSKENIKAEAFDLILQNAHTKRQYSNDEQIPRNSSIIVQRVPKEDGEKLPKIQGVNMGMVTRGEASVDSGINVTGHIVQSEFDKMTEEERLAHIKDVSTSKFQSTNFQKRATGPLTGPPPPTYTCNRCHQPGHWFKNCPLLNQKRTTGIPSQELMETTADDPLAMLHPSGKHVIPIMHWRARQHKKNVEETPVVERVAPREYTCPLCGHLLKDAVLTACCGNSFCAECISQRLMESEERLCPGANCSQKVAVDSLIPNKIVRQSVQAWQASGTPAEAQAQERIRIGILPSSSLPSTSSANALAAVGITTVSTTTITSVPVPTSAPAPTSAVAPAPGTSSVPSVSVPLPVTNFSQPPPNMMANTLAPPGTTPMLAAPIPPLIPPPIPGMGMMAPMYGGGRSTLNVNSGPQFLHAWEAFLKRNDRPSDRRDQHMNRDRKRRKRSRDRRSRSPSADDRKRMRSRGGGRGATRATNRSKDNNHSSRDDSRHHDSRDSGRTKSRRHEESSEEKSSRRRKEKEYEERKKKSRSETPKEGKESDRDEPMDEEAAIDDALKEVEELNKMVPDSEDAVDVDVDVDVPATSDDRNEEEVEGRKKEKAGDVGEKTSSEYNTSPDVRKSSAEPDEKEKKVVESSDEKSRMRNSDSATTHEEKTDVDEDVDEKKQKKHKHKHDRDGSESPRKDKKNKKHKKEKKHKKHREDETEEERKERKRQKKEKKEKKRREEDEEKPKTRSDEKERKKSSDDEKHHHHRRHKEEEKKHEKEEKKHEKEEKRPHREERKEKDERHERKRHEEEKDRRKEKEGGHHRSKEEKVERHREEKGKEDRHERREKEERHREDRHREEKGKDERHREEKKSSEASKGSGDVKKPSKLERLSEAKTKDSSGKPAVVDEKRIREHFSPPPTLLQHKKITLNI